MIKETDTAVPGALSFVMIFVDGVGLGLADPDVNPLARAHMPHLAHLLNGHPLVLHESPLITRDATLIATDATLGVAGMPQSATGQTTLLTGVNAARELGVHVGPYLNEALCQIIARASIFKTLTESGRSSAFANAYPERYFADVERGKRNLSATGLAARCGGLRLRDHHDLRQGRALSAFFTNEGWRSVLGYSDLPVVSLRQAGQTLAALGRQHAFTLFEHFQTDVCGHHQDWVQAVQVLEALDEFIGGVLDGLDDDMALIVTSDHGNVEDLTVRGHTLNPVPTLLVGKRRGEVGSDIASLADLTPAIVGALNHGAGLDAQAWLLSTAAQHSSRKDLYP